MAWDFPQNRSALNAGEPHGRHGVCVVYCEHTASSLSLPVTHLHTETYSAGFWSPLCSFQASWGPLVCKGSQVPSCSCLSL